MKEPFNNSFEFRRRIDGLVYLYHRCEDLPSGAAWKRVDKDLWVTWVNGFGWVGIDQDRNITSRPWSVSMDEQGDFPPHGEWVSKKEDKSYVYDLVYL